MARLPEPRYGLPIPLTHVPWPTVFMLQCHFPSKRPMKHTVENASMRQYYAFCFALLCFALKKGQERPSCQSSRLFPLFIPTPRPCVWVSLLFLQYAVCPHTGKGCVFSAMQSMFLSSSSNVSLCARSNVRMPRGCSSSSIAYIKVMSSSRWSGLVTTGGLSRRRHVPAILLLIFFLSLTTGRARRATCALRSGQPALLQPNVNQRRERLQLLVGQHAEESADVDKVNEAGIELFISAQVPELHPMRVVDVCIAPKHLAVDVSNIAAKVLGEV